MGDARGPQCLRCTPGLREIAGGTNVVAGPDAARFDELLARIAGEESPAVYPDEDRLLPCDREALADIAAEEAEDKVNQAWAEAAGGKAPRLAKAEYEAYLAEREAAVERARVEAAARWDEWIVRACGTVDALAGWPGTPSLPGLPGNPLPPAPAETPAPEAGLSFSRTLSTVSTPALARVLAGSAMVFVPPAIARSPRAQQRH